MDKKGSYQLRPASRWAPTFLRLFCLVALLNLGLHRVILPRYKSTRHRHHPGGIKMRYPPERGYTLLYEDSWTRLADALDRSRPRMSSSLQATERVPGIPIELMEEQEEVDLIPLDIKSITALGIHHSRFVEAIRSNEIDLMYQRSKRGIVITGGMSDYPSILVQLRLLRRTGSTLPVEVFLLDEDDFSREICESHFLAQNARCIVLEHVMHRRPLPYSHNRRVRRTIRRNEPLHKLLAVFFSRFEDVLLLGPDTLVYNNPDVMFREEPFLSKGLVLWPDFWASSISPKVEKIQGKVAPNTQDKSRTVDLGQMVISKSSCGEALLLSIYYTVYGPGLYDTLLKQSDFGEEGSQAIKTAARYLNISFYMIKRFVEAVGYPDLDTDNRNFRGVAMLQSFPLEDYHKEHKDRHRPAFIRANNPMINPLTILHADVTSFAGNNSKSHRMWEWFGGRYVSNGWRDPDPERALWSEVAAVACIDLVKVPYFKEASSQSCLDIQDHQSNLGFLAP